MKKVQFDYEYFKQHPETKLETRDGSEARFIGKTAICEEEDSTFVFETKDCILSTFVDGTYVEGRISGEDILMLVESKEKIVYANVREDGITYDYNSLDAALDSRGSRAKSVAKLTIVDGEITKCETVHKY